MAEGPPQRELYGLDKELAEKAAAKADPRQDAKLIEWVESMIGEDLGTRNLWQALKSGHALCKLVNAIRPDTITRINDKPINGSVALMERDNIKLYLGACATLGLPNQAMFLEGDLHDGKYMPGVVANLLALQARHEQEKKHKAYIAARQEKKLKGITMGTSAEKLVSLIVAREKALAKDKMAFSAELDELRQNRLRTCEHLVRVYRRKEYWEQLFPKSPLKPYLSDAMFDIDMDAPRDIAGSTLEYPGIWLGTAAAPSRQPPPVAAPGEDTQPLLQEGAAPAAEEGGCCCALM
jgi:hypothetical protein